jgi:hypothetical protein
MATTVGSHSVSAFATPVNGGPLDANVVRGNDNTIRTAYVAHDADTGIHVQSSTLASRPTAGTAGRKWITADTGVYKLWYDDGTTWHEVAAGNIDVFVIAGEALVKGDVVKVTGYNNGTGAPIVAKMASASDTAFGIVNSTTIANGATGYITNTGLILDVATNAFSIGDILYPNTSGGFTATKPTSGNYQPVAFVLRSNANNGVLYVEFSAPRIVERSDNTASTIVLRDASGNFSAGTITAGAVTSTGLVTFASLKGTGATTVTNILDEDNMASDSATALATQQSIKAYVDAKVATVDTLAEVLANGNTTGANNIIVTAGQKITTNTIDETTSGSGVTIDSVLLKDDVVNATDIETGTVSANDGTLAVTIANSTGALTLASALADSNLATISTAGKVANSATTATSTNTNSAIVARDSSGNFSAGTITANLTGNISGTAPAGTLTGTTLASNVVSSSLTSVGTLTSLAVTGDLTVDTSTLKVDSTNNRVGVVNASPAYPLDVVGPVNSATGSAAASYKINGTDVLTATTLGSGVTASSLTSVGTLSSLTVSGDLTVDTSTLKVDSANNWVGIGTTTPGHPLDVIRDSNSAVYTRIRNVNTGSSAYTGFVLNSSGNSWGIRMGSAAANTNSLTFDLDVLGTPSTKMTLDAAGSLAVDGTTFNVDATNNRVGIGTASPTVALDVYRDAYPEIRTRSASYTNTFGIDTVGGFGVLGSVTNNAFAFVTNNTEKMRLDASGNLGLGVTPSAWSASFKAFQLSGLGALWGSSTAVFLSNNTYNDGSNKYIGNGLATRYYQSTGQHIWENAVNNTGGAGAAATLVQAMTLDASGNLGVNTTNGAGRLSVRGSGTTTGYSFEAANSAGTSRFAVRDDGLIQFFSVTAGTESGRFTSGGNLLVNTTTDNGQKLQVSGTAQVTGGVNTKQGSTSVANTTWTTLFVVPQTTDGKGIYFIMGNYLDASDGQAFVTLLVDRTYARIANQSDGASVQLRLSGQNIQAYQNYGSTVTINWSYLQVQIP